MHADVNSPVNDGAGGRPPARAGRGLLFALAGLIGATALAACSADLAYGTGQAWQRSQCNRIADAQLRARCFERAATTRQDYERDRDAQTGR